PGSAPRGTRASAALPPPMARPRPRRRPGRPRRRLSPRPSARPAARRGSRRPNGPWPTPTVTSNPPRRPNATWRTPSAILKPSSPTSASASPRRGGGLTGPRRGSRGLASVDVADPAGRSGTIRAEDHGEHVPALAAAALDRRDRHRAVARDAGVRRRVRADRRQAGADRGAGPAAAQAAGRGRAPLFRRSDRSADRGRDGLLGRRGEGTRVEGAGPAARRARAGRAHDRRCGLVNTEERQLAEMLHRVTPEPPRRVTVEDVAFRVASEPRREPRSPRGSLWR